MRKREICSCQVKYLCMVECGYNVQVASSSSRANFRHALMCSNQFLISTTICDRFSLDLNFYILRISFSFMYFSRP